MEGRGAAVVRAGWHHDSSDSRRLYRKIGSSGQQARAYSHIHERETTRGGGGGGRVDELLEKDSGKISSSVVDLSSTRTEECKEVEEWKRTGGRGNPPLERVILNKDEEEEDGVNGGRMKPLTSFDLNRGLPPSQQGRKLRIKLSPPTNYSAPTLGGAGPKAIRRAQDKENGGLVPLCPGTTQIRWMKRKSVSPAELNPEGSKRPRLPIRLDNASDRLSKGPVESSAPSSVVETEGDESHGMDLLLMALKAADPTCHQSISPSLRLARPTNVKATNGEKDLENTRTTTKARAKMTHLYRSQAQTKVLREDQTASREEELKGSRCKSPINIKCSTNATQETDSSWSDDSSCSDDDVECPEEERGIPCLRPHRYQFLSKETLVEEFDRPGLMPLQSRPMSKQASGKTEKEDSSGNDEDCADDFSEKITKANKYYMTSEEALDTLEESLEASKEQDEDSSGNEGLDLSDHDSAEYITVNNRYRETSTEALDKTRRSYARSKYEAEILACSDDNRDKCAALPHRVHPFAPEKPLDKAKREFKAQNNKESELGCSVAHLENNIGGPHQYRSEAFKEASIFEHEEEMEKDFETKNVEEAEPNCSDDDLHEHALRQRRHRAAEMKRAFDETNLLFESMEKGKPRSSVGGSGKYNRKPPRPDHSASKAERRKENKGAKSPSDGHNAAVIKPLLSKLHPSEARVLLSQLKSQASSQTRRDDTGGIISHEEGDDKPLKPLSSNLVPAQAKIFLAQLKRKLQCETRKDGRVSSTCSDEEDDEPVMKPQHKTMLRPQTSFNPSEEQTFNQRVQKECRIAGPRSSTAWYQQQFKVSERDPRGYENGVGVSSPQQVIEGYIIAENSQEGVNQEGNSGSYLRKDSGWAKYPRKSSRKESLGEARSASVQQRRDTKKRKGSEDISAIYIVPKQVKLSTASCLIETGEPSHPSVGSVVVECLTPPTTEQKEDNRVPFCEVQNSIPVWRHKPLPFAHPKAANDLGKWDTDKENRSRVAGVEKDLPPSSGLKAPYVSSSQLSGVVGVAGSRGHGDTLSGNSLQPQQNSRLRLVQVGPKSSYNFGLNCINGSSVQQHQQRRSSATIGAGSIACTRDEDNETRHQIAGVTVQRRSWEALKATEYLAKKRFDSQTEVTYAKINNRPSVPSRFQDVKYEVHGVSNSKPNPHSGTQFSQGAALSASIGVTTQVIVKHRRGPKQGKQERLSTKVLNRNLENFVHLKDARSCGIGIDFDGLNQVKKGAQLPTNGCYTSHHRHSDSGLLKVSSLTTRQKRGRKKLLKEMLKNIPTKTTSSSCIFKTLSEPSGLLGDFNPGIMQRVRNSEQIHAILGAMIRAPSLPKIPQNLACVAAVTAETKGELKQNSVLVQETPKQEELAQAGNGEVDLLTKEENVENEQAHQLLDSDLLEELLDQGQPLVPEKGEPQAGTSKTHQGLHEHDGHVSLTDEVVNDDCRHEQSESPTQGLSSICGDPEFAEDSKLDLKPMSGKDCSPVGLAGRWLELLTLDIEGRLTALKRSRLRVQRTLRSGVLNPESGSFSVMSCNPTWTKSTADMDPDGSQQSVCSDAAPSQVRGDESSQQVDRWRALFTNMDNVLSNEAAKLESWLWQIQQMQAFCPGFNQQPVSGLQKANTAFCQGLATSNLGIEKQPPQRWPITIEAIEKELGFAASAASIMSTANFLTKVKSLSRARGETSV